MVKGDVIQWVPLLHLPPLASPRNSPKIHPRNHPRVPSKRESLDREMQCLASVFGAEFIRLLNGDVDLLVLGLFAMYFNLKILTYNLCSDVELNGPRILNKKPRFHLFLF